MNKRFLWTLSAGHMSTDLNQGALPAILPFLIMEAHLSYAAAAGLVFAISFASSIVQPLFGLWSDKISKPWLLPAGMILAGASLSTIGFLSSYWAMFAAVTISGIGVAAFHPEAARLANSVSGEKKGTGMSIFSVGGNIGFALGPIITTPALLLFGLSGTLVLLIPAAVVSLLLIFQPYKAPKASEKTVKQDNAPVVKDDWQNFSRLTLAIVCRSILFASLNTFIPLYWLYVLLQSQAISGTALSIFFVSGAISTLLGGSLADRFGYNRIVKYGFILLIPLLYIFTLTTDSFWATFLLIPIAFALFAISSPMVVLGQKYLPNRVGFASGITLGLAVSIGGMVAPLVGWYADHYGLVSAMGLMTIIPIVGAIVAFTLSKPENKTL